MELSSPVLVTQSSTALDSVDLASASMPSVSRLAATAPDVLSKGVLRVTNSVAQYDVSAANPKALANLGKALAGSLDRDDLTFLDPETKTERRIGDVLVAVDLSNPNQVVLAHLDTAGKGILGRAVQSLGFMAHNPFLTIQMKLLGTAADPEVIYKQKIGQMLAQLDREGLFGPPGASTFSMADWEITTRTAWRDVIIRKAL